MVKQQELQELVENISMADFGWAFLHEARFNSRLRTTGGRYLLRSHDIEINPKQLEAFGVDGLVGIIKHELCHYHLHLQGKGYKHGDADFKELLEEVGAPRFCELVPGTRNVAKMIHMYRCSKCMTMYERRRRINVGKYVCGKCKGTLKKIK